MSEALLRSKIFELRRLARRWAKVTNIVPSEEGAALLHRLISCLHEIALPIAHDEDALLFLRSEIGIPHATALDILEHLLMHPRGLRYDGASFLARMTILAAQRGIQAGNLHDYLDERVFAPLHRLIVERGLVFFAFERD